MPQMPSMAAYRRPVHLLPNAITVLALCSGLSAVQFALIGRFELSVAAGGVAALLDALDGRIARLLDATSKLGAELDSLADCVAFGVAPALVMYVWRLEGYQLGWVTALVYAVCTALRLARFNTLTDDEDEERPYAKEFFVGIPAPAGALTIGLPLYLELYVGPGWWSAPMTVGIWTLLVGAGMVSRLPTLSLKSVRVSPSLLVPLLVGVALAAAVVITEPFLALALMAGCYLALLPYTIYRYRWLARHPEAWGVPLRQRRAVVRARSARRLGLRPPRRRRIADPRRAGTTARRTRLRRDQPSGSGVAGSGVAGSGVAGSGVAGNGAASPGNGMPRRSWRRLGLRSARRR